MKIISYEGFHFEGDLGVLLDMLFFTMSVEYIEDLQFWVLQSIGKRRPCTRNEDEVRLKTYPKLSEVELSGRWDKSWGKHRVSVVDFLHLCDEVIRLDGKI